MTQQTQYAADIAAMRIAQAEAAIILQNVAKQGGETLTEVREMTKCLKAHGKSLVALETWRTEHESRHERTDGEVRGLRARINAIGAGNVVLTAVGSLMAGLFGK